MYFSPENRVDIRPGQAAQITVGYSEAAMHLKVAGKTLPVYLFQSGRMVQLHNPDGSQLSFPVTPGEAGLYPNGDGTFYGYRENYRKAG
jgi:hypothetical protein